MDSEWTLFRGGWVIWPSDEWIDCSRCGLREEELGRDGEIRTPDPLNPIQVRYQTAPRPDRETQNLTLFA